MPATVEKLDHNMVKVTADVDVETFKKALQGAFQKNKNYFQIPGFRKGKAPYGMVKNYYGEGVLYEDAIELIMDDTLKLALEELSLENASRPVVDVVDASSEKGAILTFEFAVMPEVKFGETKAIEAYRPSELVSDEDVQKEIDKDLDKASRLVPVEDRAAALGDIVKLDYTGFVDGEAFEGGKGNDHELTLGSGQFIPGFEEAVVGHTKGEEFNIDVTFPEDYGHEDLAGKAAMFEVLIKDIHVKERPEADDEFAKDMSEDANTFDEYKQIIRERLEKAKKEQADSRFRNEVVARLVSEADVDIPAVMVNERTQELISDQALQLRNLGLELEQYLQYTGMTIDQFASQMRPRAASQVRASVVLNAFAKAENIEVTDEEIDEFLKEIAERQNITFEQAKEEILPQYKGQITADKMAEKAVDKLMETAVPTDVEPVHDHDHDHHHDHDHDHDHHHDHDHDHHHDHDHEGEA